MNHPEWIAILDYGSQVTQLIARRIREQYVYCEILRYDTPARNCINDTKGLFSLGPLHVPDSDSPNCDPALFDLVPILGICYGMQLTAHSLGGEVQRGEKHEYGKAIMRITKPSPLRGVRG